MTDEHQHFRGWAASFVLGALDADDRRAFEQHLSRCPICVSELNEFAPLPSLLAKVDPTLIEHQPTADVGEEIRSAARAELTSFHRRERVWQAATAVATAAAILLAGLMLLSRDNSSAPAQQATAVVSSTAAETNVFVVPKGWGTEIVLNITALPYRDGYQLWTVDTSGDWTNAASWSPTPTGGVRLTGASRIPLDQVDRIIITSLDRDDVLVETSG